MFGGGVTGTQIAKRAFSLGDGLSSGQGKPDITGGGSNLSMSRHYYLISSPEDTTYLLFEIKKLYSQQMMHCMLGDFQDINLDALRTCPDRARIVYCRHIFVEKPTLKHIHLRNP